MSTYRLDKLFAPSSVALVGASDREGSVGLAVLRNLRAAGFPGRIDLVNPRASVISGQRAAASLDGLAGAPDLVIVASPAATVPAVIEAAGAKGAAAALVMTAGLGHGSGSAAETVRLAARRHGLRLVGPNCLGVMAPHARLNASFAAHAPAPGDLALVSQSGAVAAGARRMVHAPPHRPVGRRLPRRSGGCGFRRLSRLFRRRPDDPRHSALCRVDRRSAEIHVGGAGRRPRQAGRRHQIGPP